MYIKWYVAVLFQLGYPKFVGGINICGYKYRYQFEKLAYAYLTLAYLTFGIPQS